MRSLILIAIFAVTTLTTHAQAPYDDRPKIAVSGEAVVYVRPDKITITFGIETNDDSIVKAKADNTKLVNATVTAMRAAGVPAQEIQTDSLSIEPQYEDTYRKRTFIGYFVRNTLVVSTTDPTKVEELVTKALESGVTHIHGISFETTELRKHRDRAREMALIAAKEKAGDMARVLDQTVGAPISITESNAGIFGYYSGWGGNQGYNEMQNVSQSIAGAGSDDGIQLGKIAIRSGVYVVFALSQ